MTGGPILRPIVAGDGVVSRGSACFAAGRCQRVRRQGYRPRRADEHDLPRHPAVPDRHGRLPRLSRRLPEIALFLPNSMFD